MGVMNSTKLLAKCILRCPIVRRCSEIHSDHCSGTVADVAKNIRKSIGLKVGYNVIPKCRSELLKFSPKIEDLPPRSMKDSYTTVVLPLADDNLIRDRYVNHLGRLRKGRLLEELDMIAVWICHRHVKVPLLPDGVPMPYCFLTLLVEDIEFMNTNFIKSDRNITISGHLSWSGRTSMEITIYAKQFLSGKLQTIAKAFFLMVARNATNSGPMVVNPLKPANEAEQQCFDEAAVRQKMRRVKEAHSIFLKPPFDDEEQLMYRLFEKTKGKHIYDPKKRSLPESARWMSESHHSTLIHTFPENRNATNRIFGGYIMRNAVEIGNIVASIYVKGGVSLMRVSDVTFLNAIEVNSYLKCTAYIVYTNDKYVQIMVVATAMNSNSFIEIPSNNLYLLYEAENIVNEVLPRSYQESLWYINGRRKFMDSKVKLN